jgi:hypothetical protein
MGLPTRGNVTIHGTGPRTGSSDPQVAAKRFSWSIFQDGTGSAAVLVEAMPLERNTPEFSRCKD